MENIVLSLVFAWVSILLCWFYSILINVNCVEYKRDKKFISKELDSLNFNFEDLKDKCFNNDICLVRMLDLLYSRIDDLEKKVDKLSKKIKG